MDVLRWAFLPVVVDGLDDAGISTAIEEAVHEAIATAHGRPVLARLSLTGTTSLHGKLLGDMDRLAAECRAVGLDAKGELWVEKVEVRTRLAQPAGSDVLAPLHEAFVAGLDDPALAARLLKEMADLRLKLPAEVRGVVDLPTDEAGLRELVGDAWALAADALEASRP